MGLFSKKADPLSERARALTEEIAALEAQIRHLDSKASAPAAAPKLRSTAMPHKAATVVHPPPTAPAAEPIFEEVNQSRLKSRDAAAVPAAHFNDLGVRKYDLAGFLRRLQNHFRGPPTSNPKLVNYLAAGSIQGLRPMRYEKRVARNRFLVIAGIVLLILIGISAMFFHRP